MKSHRDPAEKPFSILRRLLTTLVFAVGSVSFAAIFFIVVFGLSKGETELGEEAEKTILNISQILIDPMWNIDNKGVGIICDIFAKDKRIQKLSVYESGGRLLYSVTNAGSGSWIQKHQNIVRGGEILGRVELDFSRGAYRAEVWRLAGVGAAASLVSLLVAFATIQALLRRYLRRPLDAMARIIDEYQLGNYRLRELDAGLAPYLEFKKLTRTLDHMGERIDEQMAIIDASQKELESRVEQRTSELAAANKDLESFSYSVSHDLRAPLRAIDGFSRALLEDHLKQLNEEGQKFLGIIVQETFRMGQLIDDLLQLARVSRAEVRRVKVDVSRMSQGIVDELRLENPGRNVSISIEPDLHLYADEGLLRIVLVNLISNAWKFTGKTPEPEIQIGKAERGGRRVFFVRDNGSGFDMAYADKLFGSFQRLHTESEFPGTGIGLATVYRVVKLHGDGIWANAKVGEGATFQFTLEDLAI